MVGGGFHALPAEILRTLVDGRPRAVRGPAEARASTHMISGDMRTGRATERADAFLLSPLCLRWPSRHGRPTGFLIEAPPSRAGSWRSCFIPSGGLPPPAPAATPKRASRPLRGCERDHGLDPTSTPGHEPGQCLAGRALRVAVRLAHTGAIPTERWRLLPATGPRAGPKALAHPFTVAHRACGATGQSFTSSAGGSRMPATRRAAGEADDQAICSEKGLPPMVPPRQGLSW